MAPGQIFKCSPPFPFLPLHVLSFHPFLPLFTILSFPIAASRPLGGLEKRYSSPSKSGQSPVAKRIFVQFTTQNLLNYFVSLELDGAPGLCPPHCYATVDSSGAEKSSVIHIPRYAVGAFNVRETRRLETIDIAANPAA